MGKLVIAALTAAVGCLASPDLALAAPKGQSMPAHAAHWSDVSAQQRPVRRVRPRITVYPRFPDGGTIGRSGGRFDVFPRPYRYEWPGPNAQRDCVSWLAPEYRPSGTVIVPRLRCRWIPG